MPDDASLSGSYLLPGVTLPRRIDRLIELVFNLVWTWQPDAQELFKLIDAQLWLECYHNPVKFLRQVKRKSLNAAIHSKRFLELYDREMAAFDAYMKPASTWYAREHKDQAPGIIAYFSTEFGLHESFPTYAGGLGILSGDHAKEASDLGLPFVGVGFLYPQGYFRQQIAGDGTQEAIYEKLSFAEVPALPAFDRDGREIV